MTRVEPDKIWWTADELAEAALPELPGTKRSINRFADRLGWQQNPDHARRRPGRGGGWEFHWRLFPRAAQMHLLKAAHAAPQPELARGEMWAAFDALSNAGKQVAEERLKAIRLVEDVQSTGMVKNVAVAHVAAQIGKSARTIYNWFDMVEGVPDEDRLAYLIPRHRHGKVAQPAPSEARPFLDHLKSQYLRIAGQTFRKCYRDAVKKAKTEGWLILHEKTAMRRIEKEVPRVTRVLAREGVAGLEKCFPAQIRDRSDLGALGAVSADCHKIDVFVEWPDGTINRPQVVVFQDLYSNKLLSWRVDHNPNKVMVMSAFGELVERWGIPKRCQFDNGREFANKWLTGGAPTRFRFKVREDDPLGVLPLLGIEIHWARPGRGQSKPIERAFRDIASDVARDPRFAGAYVGHKPDAKPENYGSRAVPAETFLRVLDEGIREHNARTGRTTAVACGRSFDAVFAESYAEVPIRKATEEQRRLWLMGQHVCKLNRDNGSIKFHGNVYHSDWMSQHPSRAVVARFDPEDLRAGLFVYDAEGAFLGFAECQQAVGFFDLASAHSTARRQARIRRAQRALLDAARPFTEAEIAADLDARAEGPSEEDLAAKVVAPQFGTARGALPNQPRPYTPEEKPELDAARDALIVEFEARKTPVEAPSKDARAARFERALRIKEHIEEGLPVSDEDARFWNRYQTHPEFEGLMVLYERHGRDGIA